MNPAKTPTQQRLTQDLLKRADALIEVMAADPEIRTLGMPTRAAMLRLAIARGLRDLERQYQRPTAPYASAPRLTTTLHDAPSSHGGTLSHGYVGHDANDRKPGVPRKGCGVSAGPHSTRNGSMWPNHWPKLYGGNTPPARRRSPGPHDDRLVECLRPSKRCTSGGGELGRCGGVAGRFPGTPAKSDHAKASVERIDSKLSPPTES